MSVRVSARSESLSPSAPPFALYSNANASSEVLHTHCSSCSEVTSVTIDRGAPFCDPCVDHGTLDVIWADWDDIGGES